MPSLPELPAWEQLQQHADALANVHMRDLFATDRQRFEHFSRQFDGLLFDFSKNRLQQQSLDLLLNLAEQAELPTGIDGLFAADSPATHIMKRRVALLGIDSDQVIPREKHSQQTQHNIRLLAGKIRNRTWLGYTGKPINTIVNIGIGGSDIGPQLLCQALAPFADITLNIHFMSSVDGSHVHRILTACDPETTLFIVASKSFTTAETMTNAYTARDWLLTALGSESAVARHFVAVSSHHRAVSAFGIDSRNHFVMSDNTIGRYSIWSAVGLSVAIYIGYERFLALCQGAHAMDEHFRDTALQDNLPVLMALVAIWNSQFQQVSSHAVLVYDNYLRTFPRFVQQLEMESCGKSVTATGEALSYPSGQVVWGGLGNNGQHAYYQLLHQGTSLTSIDFLAPVNTSDPLGDHHATLLANCLAQSAVLMAGRNAAEVRAELAETHSDEAIDALLPHLVCAGNRPSNTLLYQQLTPRTMGALMALYEHKSCVQAALWQINAFDHWGVALGKQWANKLLPELQGRQDIGEHDASTRGLLAFCRNE